MKSQQAVVRNTCFCALLCIDTSRHYCICAHLLVKQIQCKTVKTGSHPNPQQSYWRNWKEASRRLSLLHRFCCAWRYTLIITPLSNLSYTQDILNCGTNDSRLHKKFFEEGQGLVYALYSLHTTPQTFQTQLKPCGPKYKNNTGKQLKQKTKSQVCAQQMRYKPPSKS